jgi:hypothetical protein
MNKFTRIALAVATVGTISGVQADVTIRITGSTAFRGTVFNALKNNFFTVTPKVVPSSADTATSKVTFVGTNTTLFGASTKVIIQTAYSGSVEGLVNVLGTTASSPVSQPTYLKEDGTADTGTVADLAFSDVAQSTTTFSSASYGSAIDFSADPTNYPGQGVGVVTFAFVRNRNAGNLVGNITSSQFQVLAANGALSQGYFTQDITDSTPVYLTGRYGFSGTRLTVGAVTGLGANAGQTLFAASGADNITGNDVTDTPTVGSTWNGGYVSGGTVARVLNNASQANLILGYLGAGDVRSAKSNNNSVGQPLTDQVISFNGVAPSRDNVIAGTYEFWSYQHLYGKKSGVSADVSKFIKGTVANKSPIDSNGFLKALDTALQADLDNISLKQMQSQRSGDGGAISPLY